MRKWIKSGADAPYSCNVDALRADGSLRRYKRNRQKAWMPRAVLALAIAGAVGAPLAPSIARDRGQFANTSPELKSWFDSLRSAKGPCCSDADGSAVSDVDWESSSGHYKVRLDGTWFDVPDEAVITVPNRVGRTMVWPMQGAGGITIRCFMPGSMT
jgi:hypothetical protein